jgi:hypothetical protein
MFVLIDNGTGGFTARRVRIFDRVLARSQSDRLDRDLARGKTPESTVGLAIRAQLLVSPASRCQLAHDLEHISAVARQPGPLYPAKVRIDADRVRQAEADVRALADRLASPVLVAARGVAMLRVLLTDGAGPLYSGPRRDLPEALYEARHALDPV